MTLGHLGELAALFMALAACGGRTDLGRRPDVVIDDADSGLVDGLRVVPGGNVYIGDWDFSPTTASFVIVTPCRPVFGEATHIVFVPTFFLDELPVTNADYAACVETGSCDVPEDDIADPDQRPWNDSGRRKVPVLVSQRQANGYCGWLAKRLPSWAELARAAQGDAAEPGVAALTKAALDCYARLSGDPALCAQLHEMDHSRSSRPKLYDVGTVELDRSPSGHRDLFGFFERTRTYSAPQFFCGLSDGARDFVTLNPAATQHVILGPGASVISAIREHSIRRGVRQPGLGLDEESEYPIAFRCARDGVGP